ncbi:YraN family protein [Paenibacillus sp. R14(2021)]|uniref:YraN family protein n=1 Tax=Paenibacillus sp. R14(2021) TaxID=2859228 RepID=UPI0021578A9A|nr:YraN family protein [Paenibacillus sp. R14(2021)]
MNKPSRLGNARQSIGRFGEHAAEQYLIEQGYSILGRNWRCRSGELDIIAKQEKTLVIVEVRTRRANSKFGTALESVDVRKQLQVRSTTEVFLSMNKLHGMQMRFDVIAITASVFPSEQQSYTITELKHIQAAF